MKDLARYAVIDYGFQQWLKSEMAPLAIHFRENSAVIFTRLERDPQVSYLYSVPVDQDRGISWQNSLTFCGVYDAQHGALYLTDSAADSIMRGHARFIEQTIPSMTVEISGRINRCVEKIIANDRNHLPIQELTDRQALRDLQYYQEYGAKEMAIRLLFKGEDPDGQFHSGYALEELPEAAFLAYIRDPEGFVQTEAEQYIQTNQEKFLLQFLENDALLAEYQALMRNTEDPIHRMKAITDAVKASGAKTVTVTIQKDGTELTFKTLAGSLTGHRNQYSAYDISAQDRREFERLFGRRADYNADEILRITYGRNTIYEAPPMQAEDMAEGMVMGGMV